METTKTFAIRAGSSGGLVARITRLNRRAAKLGVPAIEFSISAPRLEKVGGEKYAEFVDFSVSLNIPRLSDWDFVAVIQHLPEGGNLLLTVPVFSGLDLSGYRTASPTCEHCKKFRSRSDTFVVRHASGELKQVGRDCLADFTGAGVSPEAAAANAEWLSKFLELLDSPASSGGLDDSDSFGGSKSDGMALLPFLSMVVAVSNKFGFRTGKQAQETFTSSTAEVAMSNLFPAPQNVGKCLVPSDEEVEFAKQAVVWAAALDPKNDFEHNLKTVAQSEGLFFRNTGIAAYMVQAYRNELGEVAKRNAAAKSVHFGEVGARLRAVRLTYLGSFSFDGQYGVSFIHRFQTPEGNRAVWKTRSAIYCNVGETMVADATVKKHGDYKGERQTEISRVKECIKK